MRFLNAIEAELPAGKMVQVILEPKPFNMTANPDKIIAAVRRGQQALDSIHEERHNDGVAAL